MNLFIIYQDNLNGIVFLFVLILFTIFVIISQNAMSTPQIRSTFPSKSSHLLVFVRIKNVLPHLLFSYDKC